MAPANSEWPLFINVPNSVAGLVIYRYRVDVVRR